MTLAKANAREETLAAVVRAGGVRGVEKRAIHRLYVQPKVSYERTCTTDEDREEIRKLKKSDRDGARANKFHSVKNVLRLTIGGASLTSTAIRRRPMSVELFLFTITPAQEILVHRFVRVCVCASSRGEETVRQWYHVLK